MAHERSTQLTHNENPDQRLYDEAYYHALIPHITGNVLDIGAGALMFVKRYIDKTKSVTAADKHTEEYEHPTLRKLEWKCGEELPYQIYDTIVSTEFIEHITKEELEPLIRQIKARLRGKFIGSTPNKVAPTTNPYHLYEYTLDELKNILLEHFHKVTIKDTGLNCIVWIAEQPR